ncbi:hypothetical protein ACQ86E_07060 [Bradyrhizobium betae]|uniref:hypothetical protein n=1 Tax=Bradyrhizobium betae TaxID=244734 RepID=UPI003D66EBAC
MSQNSGQVSEGELVGPQSDSVYDFLYCDTRRIGSFLSQFDDAGHLEKVVQREGVTKNAKRGFAVNVGGGASLLGTGGNGSLGFNVTPDIGGTEASERVYDPLWANALTLLDFLHDRNLLQRHLARTGIGQFVLTVGALSIVDLSIMKSILSNDLLKRSLLSQALPSQEVGNRAERRARPNRQPASPPSEMELGIELISNYPMTVQSTIKTAQGDSVWCTLKSECMVVSSGDLLLQHGVELIGEWNLVGILDAKPNEESTAVQDSNGFNPMLAALSLLAPAVRQVMGRPNAMFGITPLMIFRSVSG